MEGSLDRLAHRFLTGSIEFAECPLYERLCRVVAEDERLLWIGAECRAGQQPPNLLFAAVHRLVLDEPSAELARWYPSVDGDRARAAATVGPAFTAFCLAHREAIVGLVRTRLVQTNVVRRAAALSLGMARIAERVADPVTLVEVGASAGALLAFDRYTYAIAGRTFRAQGSTVRIDVEWRGDPDLLPDLDGQPRVTTRLGIDLAPVDARDADARSWLRALVWPGNEDEWVLLDRALESVASDPPRILAGDAIELLGRIPADGLLPDGPLVVFHAATRAHVPPERRAAFDGAIRALADGRRLFWLSLEGPREPVPGFAGPMYVLELAELDGSREAAERLAAVDGHARWIAPLPPA